MHHMRPKAGKTMTPAEIVAITSAFAGMLAVALILYRYCRNADTGQ